MGGWVKILANQLGTKIGMLGENNKYFCKVNLDPWFVRNQESLLKHVYHVVVV